MAGKKPKTAAVSTLAKLSAPLLGRQIARPRLFRLLERAGRQSVVWLSAPAGSGKTTLAASFLRARRRRGLWIQLDPGDGDPASLFYYLGLAAQRLSPRRQPLPPLTPEYLLALPVYVRGFFRELGARLKTPAAIVLDDYHMLPATSPVHDLLAAGAGELPRGINLLVLSRDEPPPAMARLQASGTLVRFDPAALKFDAAETRAVLGPQRARGLSRDGIAQLQARTDGWAAGLQLLLQADSPVVTSTTAPAGTPAVVFDYFAAEVFQRAPPRAQAFLLKTALLPHVDVAAAGELAGEADPDVFLGELVRKNYFTYRLAGGAHVYQYHPLFREFLLERGKIAFAPEERQALVQRAGQLLVARGLYEDAAQTMLAAQDGAGLARLIVMQAPALAGQGRLQTLAQWLAALPPELVQSQGWLLYWQAVARMPLDLAAARALFEQAAARFDAAGDARGVYLSWAGVGQVIFYAMDAHHVPARQWLAAMEAVEQRYGPCEEPQIEARVALGALSVLRSGIMMHPAIHRWVERARELLRMPLDADARIHLACFLLFYYVYRGDFPAARMVAETARPLIEKSPRPSLTGIGFLSLQFTLQGLEYEIDAALHSIEQGLSMAEASGIHVMDAMLHGQACFLHGGRGDIEQLRESLEQMRRSLLPGRRLDQGHYHLHASRLALLEGRHNEALAQIEESERLSEELGPGIPRELVRIGKADTLMALGRYAEARRYIEATERFAHELGSDTLLFTTGLMHAWLALNEQGEAACAQRLQPALALGRGRGYVSYVWWSSPVMARLCEVALRHDIETDYVMRLIRRRELEPPASAYDLDTWPRPIKIYTLGRFSVLLDGKPLRFQGKAQKRPLELLKALIALGARDVPEGRVIEALWSQAEGDLAKLSLNAAIHRLRKLLGTDAVVFQSGKLSLDARFCWVDLWSTERALSGLARACQQRQGDEMWVSCQRLFALYRGSFLESEADAPWLLAARERLRSRFVRELQAAANCLREHGEAERAIQCGEKALEVEPLAEELYRTLIRAQLAVNRPAEALSTYRRCRRMLTTHLGLEPTAETQTLVRGLGTAR